MNRQVHNCTNKWPLQMVPIITRCCYLSIKTTALKMNSIYTLEVNKVEWFCFDINISVTSTSRLGDTSMMMAYGALGGRVAGPTSDALPANESTVKSAVYIYSNILTAEMYFNEFFHIILPLSVWFELFDYNIMPTLLAKWQGCYS